MNKPVRYTIEFRNEDHAMKAQAIVQALEDYTQSHLGVKVSKVLVEEPDEAMGSYLASTIGVSLAALEAMAPGAQLVDPTSRVWTKYSMAGVWKSDHRSVPSNEYLHQHYSPLKYNWEKS